MNAHDHERAFADAVKKAAASALEAGLSAVDLYDMAIFNVELARQSRDGPVSDDFEARRARDLKLGKARSDAIRRVREVSAEEAERLRIEGTPEAYAFMDMTDTVRQAVRDAYAER